MEEINYIKKTYRNFIYITRTLERLENTMEDTILLIEDLKAKFEADSSIPARIKEKLKYVFEKNAGYNALKTYCETGVPTSFLSKMNEEERNSAIKVH